MDFGERTQDGVQGADISEELSYDFGGKIHISPQTGISLLELDALLSSGSYLFMCGMAPFLRRWAWPISCYAKRRMCFSETGPILRKN
jgi:hypothetical protein